jgi:hypothetical protein
LEIGHEPTISTIVFKRTTLYYGAMAQYNADVLQRFADDLYAKAALITGKTAVLGGLIGALLVAPLYVIDVARSSVPQQREVILVVPVLIGVLVGSSIGKRKSFNYKLQAQMTLCQMQIEFNSRRQG